MKKGILATTFAYILWGILPIYWKLLSSVSPLYILASRIVWSLGFCVLMLSMTKEWSKIKQICHNKRCLKLMLLASISITVNWFTYIWAVNSGHVIESSMGYFMNPLVVILISGLCFKEKFNKWEMLSVGLAGIGILIMIIEFGKFPFVALSLAFSFAIYGALKKQANLEPQISLTLETAVVFPIALIYLLVSEINGTGAIGILSTAKLFLLPLTGVVTAIPLLLFGYGVKKLPFSVVGFFQYISPTLTLILGIFVYKESFTTAHLTTFGFIWVALAIFVFSKIGIFHLKAKKEELSAKTMR
ncbi:protein RarD [Sporanaerobium hydrogeniformans]|uniref:Protein RarD n=1 Tax=Sporanaerobium hydrogeniformans TaxID=3072179 RepID=A0AC61D9N7_9FIRM|nr:EamA family transporter RarD [Sporanaerobium hydrogeniformans]PHV69443.1 protein RarD [Sporanaerobium hydrogeniformans]